MQLEVHVRNGRTVFRFAQRSHFRRALQNKPDHEGPRIHCEVKHSLDEEQAFRPVSIRSFNPNSVSFVLEVPRDQPVEGSEEKA
jgi:hypothetical protein